MQYTDKPINNEFWGNFFDPNVQNTNPAWVRQDSSDTTPFAFRLPLNDWGYLWDGSSFKSTHWAQPLDNSPALWYIKGNSSFASFRTIMIEDDNYDLSVQITTQTNEDTVPLMIDCKDLDHYYSAPIWRVAYDESFNQWAQYDSFMLYDISYKDVVLTPGVTIYNTEIEDEEDFGNLSELQDYLENDMMYLGDSLPVILTYGLNCGIVTPRDTWMYGKAEGDGYMGSHVKLIADVNIEKVVPDNEDIKLNFRKTYGWDSDDPSRRDDAYYQPFVMPYSSLFYKVANYYPDRGDVCAGYMVDVTHDQIINGAYETNNGSNYVTGFISRMSTVHRNFDDVAYHWEDCIYNEEEHDFIEPGYTMTGETGDAKYKFMSLLVIDDRKNHSREESFVNAIKHEYAFMGFYFADNNTIAQTKQTGSETDGIGLYLPNRSLNIPDGTYVTGADIKDSPYADMESTVDLAPSEEGAYTARTPDLSSVTITTNSVHLYTLVNLPQLIDSINGIPAYDGNDQPYSQYLFFGSDPYDYLLGYYLTPTMFIPQWYLDSSDQLDYIHLGKFVSDSTFQVGEVKAAPILLRTPLRRRFIMPTKIPRYYNNFMDFEPYTSLSLYLPFAGTTDLPPSVFMGHTITVYSSYDLLAGVVTYIIYADKVQFTTVSANARLDIPIHGSDLSAYNENMASVSYNKQMNFWNSLQNTGSAIGRAGASTAISVIKGNTGGAVTSALGGVLSIYSAGAQWLNSDEFYRNQLERTSAKPLTISCGSIADGFANTLQPYLMVNLPLYVSGFETETFGEVNGFACYYDGVINTTGDNAFHGFTMIVNPILDNIPISQAEKELLRSLLAKGVILP